MKVLTQEDFQELYKNHIDYLTTKGIKGKLMEIKNCRICWSLENADLSQAVFNNCHFILCTFKNCNFYNAIFKECKFSNNLCGAFASDFTDTCFVDCDFYHTNFADAINFDKAKFIGYNNFLALQCPNEGSFIGWKLAKREENFYVLKLEIPANAKRSSATTRKCRASKAKVLEIQKLNGEPAVDVEWVNSLYYEDFTYSLGRTVTAKHFDTNRWRECSNGIHFFITRDEVIDFYKQTFGSDKTAYINYLI